MKIIPVIDILDGIVVHAVKGKRSLYRPLKSALCESAEPLAVASAFKACDFTEMYVADLDSIIGKSDNFGVIQQISEKTGLNLMVDAGISEIEEANRLFRFKASKVIIGTETLPNIGFLKEAIECFGNERIVVSLDLNDGKLLSNSESIRSLDPFALVTTFQNVGVTELILIDLARVGSGRGVDLQFLRRLLDGLKMHLIVGGGVQEISDLFMLRDMGVSGVLMATALHSKLITMESLQHANMLKTPDS